VWAGEVYIVAHYRKFKRQSLLCSIRKSLLVLPIHLLAELEKENPQIRQVMLAALKNVRPSHLFDQEVAAAWASQAGKYEPRR